MIERVTNILNLGELSKRYNLEATLKRYIKPKEPSRIQHVGLKTVRPSECYSRLKEAKIKTMYKPNLPSVINDYGDDVLNINWAYYKKKLNQAQMGHLIDQFQLDQRARDQKLLKEVSTYALKCGPTLKGWNYLVGIEQMYGYNYEPELNIQQDLNEWVIKQFVPQLNGSEELFLERFRDEVENILNWKEGQQEFNMSPARYCIDPTLTGTNGSAYDPDDNTKFTIEVKGETVKPEQNKYSKSLALSKENKIKRLFKRYIPKARLNRKVEIKPKVRWIISADYTMTLKMRYIDQWLSRWMDGNENSTLWMTKRQLKRFWISFSKPRRCWFVPIDQSAFDHHVSKRMIAIINTEIYKCIDKHATGENVDDLLLVMQSIIDSLPETRIQYEISNGESKETHTTKWMNGVLSGWQWTAFYDTIANIAEKNMALGLIREQGVDIKIGNFNAQGDDQNNEFETLTEGILYWAALSSMGFEIHISKNFFSQVHNEYLRAWTDTDGRNGYPTRMVNGLLWLYPGDTIPNSTVERLSGLYSKWSKFYQRLGLSESLMLAEYKSDCRGMKIPPDKVDKYVNAYVLDGGRSYEQKPNPVKITNIPGQFNYRINIDDKGYEEFEAAFGQGQEMELRQWVLDVTNVKKLVIGTARIYDEPTFVDEPTSVIKPIPFAVIPGLEIHRPKLDSEYLQKDLFSAQWHFIKDKFDNLETYISKSTAPRTWMCDYLVGRIKVLAPKIPNYSDEMSSLVTEEFENSLISAMMRKRHADDKWRRLQAYYISSYDRINQLIGKTLPKYMY